MPSPEKITPRVVERFSEYLRALAELSFEGKISASSAQIASKIGRSPDLVRKDLALIGSFGKRGVGYDIDELDDAIRTILGIDKRRRVALVGFGQLGQSLIRYNGLSESGFEVCAIFEIDRKLIGNRFEEIPIYSAEQMPEICEKETILLAIVAVPAENAHSAFQQCLDAGIRGILNFTDRTGFNPPPHAKILNVNIAVEMESLSYFLKHS